MKKMKSLLVLAVFVTLVSLCFSIPLSKDFAEDAQLANDFGIDEAISEAKKKENESDDDDDKKSDDGEEETKEKDGEEEKEKDQEEKGVKNEKTSNEKEDEADSKDDDKDDNKHGVDEKSDADHKQVKLGKANAASHWPGYGYGYPFGGYPWGYPFGGYPWGWGKKYTNKEKVQQPKEKAKGYWDHGYPGMGYPGIGYPGIGYPGGGYPDGGYPGGGYPMGFPVGYPYDYGFGGRFPYPYIIVQGEKKDEKKKGGKTNLDKKHYYGDWGHGYGHGFPHGGFGR